MAATGVSLYIFQSYNEQLAQTAQQLVGTTLQWSAGFSIVVAQVVVLLIAKGTMLGGMSADRAVTYMVRLVIVMMLMVPATFNKYITTTATKTIPNQIASTVNGNSSTTVAQAFQDQRDAIENIGAKLRAQATGLEGIPERVTIWFYVGVAQVFIDLTEAVWGLVAAVIPFMLPLGAILLWGFVFEATSQWAMRWVGKIISLFLVMFCAVQLGAFVSKVDGVYLQQYGDLKAAAAPSGNFQMNSGDKLFEAFGLAGADPPGGVLPGNVPTAAGAVGANVPSGIATLKNIGWVVFIGWFILSIMTGIAMYLGGAHGFSFAPITGAVSFALRNVRK